MSATIKFFIAVEGNKDDCERKENQNEKSLSE